MSLFERPFLITLNTRTKTIFKYQINNWRELGPVQTYPGIFQSATFSLRIRLPFTHISGESGVRIRNLLDPLSRVEILDTL